MRLLIHVPNPVSDPDPVAVLNRKIRYALSRVATRVRSVRVRVVDDNGPRGGVDHRCTIEAKLIPRGRVRAESRGSDPTEAGIAAIHRLARGVHRELDRHRSLARVAGRRRAAHERDADAA